MQAAAYERPLDSPPEALEALFREHHGAVYRAAYRITEIPFDDWVRELARQAARDPSHPMATFLPLFVGHAAGGFTVAEMYLSHVFPVYGRFNTEHALLGTKLKAIAGYPGPEEV